MKNNRIEEADMYAQLAKEHPGHQFIVPKNSKDPALRLNKMLKARGIDSRTKTWRYQDGSDKGLIRYSVRFGVDLVVKKEPKPRVKVTEPKFANETEPDMVIADDYHKAYLYCRGRGWNPIALAWARGDKDIPAKLASLINPVVVEL